MQNNPRMIGGAACAAAGLALVVLPQGMVPWLPGSMGAGVVLLLSGAMFLIRGGAERKNAPISGSDSTIAPDTARNQRKRRKKS